MVWRQWSCTPGPPSTSPSSPRASSMTGPGSSTLWMWTRTISTSTQPGKGQKVLTRSLKWQKDILTFNSPALSIYFFLGKPVVTIFMRNFRRTATVAVLTLTGRRMTASKLKYLYSIHSISMEDDITQNFQLVKIMISKFYCTAPWLLHFAR